MSNINTVLVMGAGTMGASIAQVFAVAGKKVYLVDQTEELLDRARGIVRTGITTMLKEELYSVKEVSAAEANIIYATAAQLVDIGKEADLVLESVFERPDVKQSVFRQLDEHCREDCIFCSNTSASNVFSFVEVSHPERFLITHWFNPAYLMKLVEVVKGPDTSDEIKDRVVEFLESAGKKVCVLNQYVPGFIVNRMANAISREAGYMVENGWTTGKDIDAAIEAIDGVRYAFEGPLALNDVIGWDLILTGCHDVFASLCNDSETSALAERLVKEGKLGVKSGSGVYDYSDTTQADFMRERAAKIIKMYKAIENL